MSSEPDTSPGLLDLASVTPVEVKSSVTLAAVTIDLYTNRTSASVAGAGTIFYASDQVALYLSNGTSWLRVGPGMPGDIIWTNEAVARSGFVLLDGSAWPSTTGIYTDLYGLWGGTNLPDVVGRTFAAKGTHADMATLLGNEGVATKANRRQKHQTTDAKTIVDPGHRHNLRKASDNTSSTAAENAPSGTPTLSDPTAIDISTTGITLGGSIGTNVGTDPVDTGAYIVLQPQAKL